LSTNKFIAVLHLLFFSIVADAAAQGKYFTLSGTVRDAKDGEDLIGVNIYARALKSGTVTNTYGYYSLLLPAGKHELEISSMGYVSQTITVNLSAHVTQNIRMEPSDKILQEVTIAGEQRNNNIVSPDMGVQRLSSKIIKAIPAMMGEVDVIKAIQLLPGVQSVSEGSSSFSVRGGGHDQNLILLDEATVYNASHLMGFFSIFNNEIVKDVKLYKGDIPAVYGGRLSSLMEVHTKDGNNRTFGGSGGIGTISSRLMLEGPIIRDRASFIVAGRRTYADVFLPLARNEELHNNSLYFYDLNAKINFRINNRNRVFLSGYMGDDHFANNIAGMNFGNKTFSARWNWIVTPRLFANFTLTGSQYDYYTGITFNEHISQDWKSRLRDFGSKADFSYHINPEHAVKFGYNGNYHIFFPGNGGGVGEQSIIKRFNLPQKYSGDHAAYISAESTLWGKLTLRYGLRYSVFQNIGNGEKEYLLTSYAVTDSAVYERGKVYHTHSRLEPRFGINYVINDHQSVKASYSRTAQYIQLASNSAAGSPLDIWFQVSKNIQPQINDQFSAGYFHNFSNDTYETSIEFYYKDMKHVVDFRDRANLLGNAHLDRELRFGVGKAYGVELMARKNSGTLTGWVSYTLSRSLRKIDTVNNDDWYRSPYDRPHNISAVLNYELSPKWSVSANWVYATGIPVTYPVGRFEVENVYIPIYSKRNEYRYPDYHRMDIAAVWKISKPEKRFQHELNFSLYNAYGRKNPWAIYFNQEEDNPNVSYAEMLYLFSFVPSITWNFSF
jgi:hypothetical protein